LKWMFPSKIGDLGARELVTALRRNGIDVVFDPSTASLREPLAATGTSGAARRLRRLAAFAGVEMPFDPLVLGDGAIRRRFVEQLLRAQSLSPILVAPYVEFDSVTDPRLEINL